MLCRYLQISIILKLGILHKKAMKPWKRTSCFSVFFKLIYWPLLAAKAFETDLHRADVFRWKCMTILCQAFEDLNVFFLFGSFVRWLWQINTELQVKSLHITGKFFSCIIHLETQSLIFRIHLFHSNHITKSYTFVVVINVILVLATAILRFFLTF